MTNYMKKFSLKNKTAFVTGGAGLIGSEVTKALADAGAHVIILDVDSEKGERLAEEIKASGNKADHEYFDITKTGD
ncbi:MAG: SDR family NAD(P)-dependent oxidoreductase, partial [Candidatus Omnitrophota bacterium]